MKAQKLSISKKVHDDEIFNAEPVLQGSFRFFFHWSIFHWDLLTL